MIAVDGYLVLRISVMFFLAFATFFIIRGAVLGHRLAAWNLTSGLRNAHAEATNGVYCTVGCAVALLLFMREALHMRMGNTWLLPLHLVFVSVFVLAFLLIRHGGYSGDAVRFEKRRLHRTLAYTTVGAFMLTLVTGSVMLWT